jgi:hypothetical protein
LGEAQTSPRFAHRQTSILFCGQFFVVAVRFCERVL